MSLGFLNCASRWIFCLPLHIASSMSFLHQMNYPYTLVIELQLIKMNCHFPKNRHLKFLYCKIGLQKQDIVTILQCTCRLDSSHWMFTWKVINKVVILQTKIKLGNNLDSKVVEQWTHVDTSPIYSSFTRVNYTMTPNNPVILSPASIPTPKQETTSWPPTPQLKSSTPISTSKEVFIILPQWWDVVITLST